MSLKQQKKYKKQEEDEKIKKYKFSENDKKQFFSMNIQIDPQIPAQKLKVFPLSDPYKLSWQVLEDTGLNEEHYQIVFNQIAKYQRKLKLYIINKNKNQQQYKNQPNHINQYSETYNSPYTSPKSPNFKQQVFLKNHNNSPNNLQETGVQTDPQTLKLKQIEIRSNNSSPDQKVIQDIHLKFEQENSPNQSKEIVVIEKEQQKYQEQQQQIQPQLSKYQQQNNQQFLEQITEIPESNIQSEMNSHINSTQNQQLNPQSQNINTQNSQQEYIQEIKNQTHESNINLKDQEQIQNEQNLNQNEKFQNTNQNSQIPQSNNFQPLSQQQFQQSSPNPQNLAQNQNQFQPQHFIPMIPYILPFNNQLISQFNSYNPYQNHLSSFKLNQNPLDFEIYQHSNPQSKRSNSQDGETEENKEKEKNSKNSQNKQKTKNNKHTIQQKNIQTQRITQTKVSSQLLTEIDEYKKIKDSLKQYQTLNQTQQINIINEQKTDSESSIPENIIEKPETLFLERQNQQNNDQYLRQISSQKNHIRSPSPIQTQRTDFSRFSKISEPEISNSQPLNIEQKTNYLDYKNEKLLDNMQTSSQIFKNLNQNQDLTEINQLKLQELYQKQQECLNQQLQQILQTQTQIQQTQQSVFLQNSTNSINNNIQQIQQEISQSQKPQIFQNQNNQKIYYDQNIEKKNPQQQQQSELLQSPVQRNVETFGKKETQNIRNNQDLDKKQDQNQKQQNNINSPQNQHENNYQQQYDYYLLNSQRDSVMKQHQNQYKSPNNHKQCNNCSCLNDSFQGSVQFDEGIESQFQSVQNKNDQNRKDIYSKLIDASPQSSQEKRSSNYQTIQKKNQNINNTDKETPKRKYLNLDNTQHIENDFTNEMFQKQNQNNNFNKIEPQKIENLIDPSQQKLTISQKQQQPKQPKNQIHPQIQEKLISQANRSNTQQSSSNRTQYELQTDRELEQNPFENKQITTQKIKNKFRSTPTQYTSNKKTLTLEVDKEEQEANPIVFTDSVYSEMETKEQFLNSTARIPPNKWNDIQVSVSGNDFIVLQKSKNKELVDELNGYQYKLLLKLFKILDEEGLGYIQSINIDPFKRLNGSLRLLCQQVIQFALNQKSQVFFQDFIVSASLTKVIGDLFKLSKSYLGEQNNTLNSHQYTENYSQNNQYTQQSQY
ncbi:hypothetical protein PPERSA_13165 [Pseudocohnilembus persalinus]|uniref:Uncharacterized protein n=1 Tax=Pseudocohnilembus persalinus TaxID=266149 RepID=A0A0V0QKT9_PSEPJ|nr:hypothetical protein PPERSA_13165 [Pseudocohnilembus persalinus]|eukprot:KRX02911.1 hypothetical protein PPERSA_13165 [Pseudocohnilembus persalinus]